MRKRLTENPNVPRLDSWITLPEVAAMMGVSRQHIYNKAANGDFRSLHRVGAATFIVDSREVEEKLTASRIPGNVGDTDQKETE